MNESEDGKNILQSLSISYTLPGKMDIIMLQGYQTIMKGTGKPIAWTTALLFFGDYIRMQLWKD
jgi:hypothetical protein